jgi:hypothetical protein
MNVGRVDVGIQGCWCWGKEDVAVGVQNRVTFIMEMVESYLEFPFPGNRLSFGVGAMDGVASELPHQEVFTPW